MPSRCRARRPPRPRSPFVRAGAASRTHRNPDVGRCRDDRLFDLGQRRLGGRRQDVRTDRDRSPHEHPDTAYVQRRLDEGPRLVEPPGGHECHHETHALAWRGFDALGSELPLEQPVRDPGHHAGAVPGAIGRAGTTMIEVVEAFDREAHDPVRSRGRTVGHEPDATGVVVLGRVVQRVAGSHRILRSGAGKHITDRRQG